MWKCPKCSREFKKVKQDHFCIKPNSIEEYIAAQPKDVANKNTTSTSKVFIF